MEVKFVDTGYISKLKIRDEAVNFGSNPILSS